MLRSLIDRVELRLSGDGKGVAATLQGDLARILALCDDSAANKNAPKPRLRGVNCRRLRGLEATYTEQNSTTTEKLENSGVEAMGPPSFPWEIARKTASDARKTHACVT